MLFTKTEIDIAKQMIKVGFTIIVACLLLVWITSFITGINNTSPNKVDAQVKQEVVSVIKKPTVKAEVPITLEIPGYNVNANIESPNSVQVEVLDNALSQGAVYYPGSGYPGSNNTLIFGYSLRVTHLF